MSLGPNNFDEKGKAQKEFCIINFQKMQKSTRKGNDGKLTRYRGFGGCSRQHMHLET